MVRLVSRAVVLAFAVVGSGYFIFAWGVKPLNAATADRPSPSVLGAIWPLPETVHSELCSDILQPDVFRTLSSSALVSCVTLENVNNRNSDGWTVLYLAAAYSDDAALVRHFIALGADMTLLDRRRREAIHVAAEVGISSDVIAALALAGADVNALMDERTNWSPFVLTEGHFGTSPLHLAAARQDADDLVAALLLADAEPNRKEPDLERTPLHVALENGGRRSVVGMLLQKGADVNAADETDITPFMLAVRNDPDSVLVQWMLEVGGDPDHARADGTTSLMVMAQNAKTETAFRSVLDASDKPCAKDARDLTALDYAESNARLHPSPTYWILHDMCNADE